MSTTASHQDEVDRNFERFEELLPELLRTHLGKFALMRRTECVEFFDTPGDALRYARAQFPDGCYSLQEVSDRIVSLGFAAYAMPQRAIQP